MSENNSLHRSVSETVTSPKKRYFQNGENISVETESSPPNKKQLVSDDEKPPSCCFSSELSLEAIRKKIETFSNDRNWNQFHRPRNLLLALVGEVGELSEIFQWKGEVPVGLPDWSNKEKEHLGEELSDVLIYLVRLADRCNVDLPTAVLRKFELNEKKYPASIVKGSNKKYNEYKEVDGKLSITPSE